MPLLIYKMTYLKDLSSIKLASGVMTAVWLGVFVFIAQGQSSAVAVGFIVLPLLSTVFLGLTAVVGPSRLSAMAGKILIFAGLFSGITLLLRDSLEFNHPVTAVVVGVLISGLFLERVSPHQPLKTWMFLAIATKVEFLLVATLTAGLAEPTLSSLWWILVILMAVSVPVLAFKLKTLYRVIVWITTLLAVALVLNLIFTQVVAVAVVALAQVVAVWPVITERLIGHRSFLEVKDYRN